MKNKFLVCVIAILTFSTSCKKMIEIEETDFIDADKALTNVSNIEEAIIGAYAAFNTEMSIQLNGVFSDELKSGDFYNAQTTHEWQFTSSDIGIRDNYTAINPLYSVINRINMALRALPNAKGTTAADEALRSKVKGEALFLRAYCHFELFRYYCGNYDVEGLAMPYMEVPSLETFARIKMGPYFQKIETDLTEAKTLLPTSLTDIYRATKLAATGLQARIALYKRDWPNAITFASEYISGIPLASKTDFPRIWKDSSNSELSYKIKKVNTQGRLGSFYRGIFTKNPAGDTLVPASIPWVPSDKLWSQYNQSDDIRFSSYLIDEPRLAAVAGKPHKIVKKYAGAGYTNANENVADVKVFRTAEMYLIRAEARAEQDVFTGANSAESDINELRAARINGYTNVIFTSKADAITEIVNERFKELAFEGHRFWDLRRRGLPVQRLASDAPNADATTLPANNFRFVLPIPRTEMQANPKMVQNPGYAE